MNATSMSRPGAAARLIALTAALLLLGAAPAHADPRNDKDRVDAELARTSSTLDALTARAQQAVADYTKADAELPAAQDRLADARKRVAAAQVAAGRADLAAASAEAANAEAAQGYVEAVDKVDRAHERFDKFVVSTYEGSGFLALDSILDAGSPSEFALRLGYLDQVAGSNQRALDALTAARTEAGARANAAETARQKADEARERAGDAVTTAQAAAATAEQAATDVQTLVDQRQQAMVVANQERAVVIARYNELKAESERIAAELRAAAARARATARTPARAAAPRDGRAFFLMPTAGYKSSDFGMRYDPYYRVWQLHAGVDIAAPVGQAIYAAGSGRVVNSGWSGGYGNYTCISHGVYKGRDLETCYGHQSAILVSPGQWVRRGQLIGRVGSTGASTGPHLHFEVRRDGTPVDPLPWLPRCLC